MKPRVIVLSPGQEVIIRCSGKQKGGENSESNDEFTVNNVSENSGNSGLSGGKKNTTRKSSGKKRGPNAYMKFAAKVRPQVLQEHPELKSDVVGVAKKIGEKWRALSDEERKAL